jgi:hypothetical protein
MAAAVFNIICCFTHTLAPGKWRISLFVWRLCGRVAKKQAILDLA